MAPDCLQHGDHKRDHQYGYPGAFDKFRRQDHGERRASSRSSGSVDEQTHPIALQAHLVESHPELRQRKRREGTDRK